MQVGGYEILGELGRGRLGVVYLARQPSMQRWVALKLLTPDDGVVSGRLRNAAAVLAGLAHPYILPPIDVGEHEGQLYLVMPYCPGGTLAQAAAHRPLTPGQVAGVVAACADALADAHARGLVHGALKPSNILLSEAGDPYLADFGQAAPSTPGGPDGSGSLSYLAPEIRHGTAPTACCDVYALGRVAFELLTGEQRHLELGHPPVLPALREVAPGVPAVLADAVDAALSERPDQRPDDLRALCRRLRVEMPDEPLLPPPTALRPSTPTRTTLDDEGTVISQRAIPPPEAVPDAPPQRRGRRALLVAVGALIPVCIVAAGLVAMRVMPPASGAVLAGAHQDDKSKVVPIAEAAPTPSASPAHSVGPDAPNPMLDRLVRLCGEGDVGACVGLLAAAPSGSQYAEFARACQREAAAGEPCGGTPPEPVESDIVAAARPAPPRPPRAAPPTEDDAPAAEARANTAPPRTPPPRTSPPTTPPPTTPPPTTPPPTTPPPTTPPPTTPPPRTAALPTSSARPSVRPASPPTPSAPSAPSSAAPRVSPTPTRPATEVAEPPEDAPNDSEYLRRELHDGQASAELLEGEVHTYEFQGLEGETVEISLFAGDELDGVLAVYGPDGSEVASNDDCEELEGSGCPSPNTFDPYVFTVLPESGTYALDVSAWEGSSAGSYDLDVNVEPQ